MIKLDILAFAAHPDDTELSCCGTILKHIDLGYKVGVIDLTQGELGTRGNAKIRMEEARAAAEYIGLSIRENLLMADGFFNQREENIIAVIRKLRKYRPKIVLANALDDRHPDHGRAAKLISKACFLSGLIKVNTKDENGNSQEAWRPSAVYHYIQDYNLDPDFVIDVSTLMDRKIEAIKKFKSQFYDPNSTEPESPISSKNFLEFIRSKARVYGRHIGAEYGEGFNAKRYIGVNNLFDLQ